MMEIVFSIFRFALILSFTYVMGIRSPNVSVDIEPCGTVLLDRWSPAGVQELGHARLLMRVSIFDIRGVRMLYLSETGAACRKWP